MAIMIKSDSQIDKMRESGRIVARAHELLEKNIRIGITTKELNSIAEDFISSCNGIPSFKGYRGFPESICVSVNNEVIHGIPGLRKLKDGDIVSVDIGVYKNGFHADAARTFIVGNASESGVKLVEVTKASFFEGIKLARLGHHLHEISACINDYVESFGFTVVREFVGHGVGKHLHEDPQIPHYRQRTRGPRLTRNMTLAIEPMVNMGSCDIEILSDEWTVVTKDGKLSAHYENTVAITDGEPDLLTVV